MRYSFDIHRTLRPPCTSRRTVLRMISPLRQCPERRVRIRALCANCADAVRAAAFASHCRGLSCPRCAQWEGKRGRTIGGLDSRTRAALTVSRRPSGDRPAYVRRSAPVALPRPLILCNDCGSVRDRLQLSLLAACAGSVVEQPSSLAARSEMNAPIATAVSVPAADAAIITLPEGQCG